MIRNLCVGVYVLMMILAFGYAAARLGSTKGEYLLTKTLYILLAALAAGALVYHLESRI